MNWYATMKTAALEPKWWLRFFQHLSGAAKYTFPDQGVSRDPTDFRILLQPNSFETINDGPTINFAFYVWRKGHSYRCSISLMFAQSLNGSKMQWEPGSKIVGLQEQEGNDFVRANWSVIRDFHDRKNVELVTNGVLVPAQATPLILMETLKSAVLRDGEDDDDDTSGFYDSPKPPGKKMPKPAAPKVKPQPVLAPQLVESGV